jgi:hypothetical protein
MTALAALAARIEPFADADREFSLLSSSFEPPNIRARLHAICALYAHTAAQTRRMELLNALENVTLEVAHLLALDLLENGWRPEPR